RGTRAAPPAGTPGNGTKKPSATRCPAPPRSPPDRLSWPAAREPRQRRLHDELPGPALNRAATPPAPRPAPARNTPQPPQARCCPPAPPAAESCCTAPPAAENCPPARRGLADLDRVLQLLQQVSARSGR